MKKLLFLSGCCWMLAAAPARAQAVAGAPGLAVVRVFDNGATVNAIITRGVGQNEKVEFASGGFDKKLQASGEGYYQLFQKLYQEGYTLQSTFAAGSNGLITLLFTKSQGR